MGAIIKSVGIYSPERILTNYDLEKILAASGSETSNKWIIERTGITKRKIARTDESPETMAVAAARDALDRLTEDIPPIQHILIATNTGERRFPSQQGFVQKELIKSHPKMIDLNSSGSDAYTGCAGKNVSLMYADALTQSGFFKTVLVVGTEKLSSIVDYSDRGTCVLFGDGASAYIVTRNAGSGGFLGHMVRGNGIDREMITCEENAEKVTFEEAERAVREERAPVKSRGRVMLMDGRGVFKYVVNEWKELISGFSKNKKLNPYGVPFEKVTAISPHLANLRMLTALDEKNPGFLKKCELNGNGENEHFCNTSTASQGRRDRLFLERAKSGDTLLNFGYGAGLISCANFYEMP